MKLLLTLYVCLAATLVQAADLAAREGDADELAVASESALPVWGWHCTNHQSEFSVLLSADEKAAAVYRGSELKTTLQCRQGDQGTDCWEKNLVDAGYTFHAAREILQTHPERRAASLSEVFIWGTRLVASLSCLRIR